jgi:hypothetical protein
MAKQDRSQKDLMEEAQIHALGKDLVSRFAMLLKTVRIHSVNNAALQYSVRIFCDAAQSLYGHLGDYTLRGDIDSMFVDNIRIRAEPILWDNIVHLLTEFADRRIGGLRINGPLDPIETRKLLQLLLDFPALTAAEGARHLNEQALVRGLTHLEFMPQMTLIAESTSLMSEQEAQAKRAIRVYAELLVVMHTYLTSTTPTVPEFLRGRMLQAVQAAVDLMHEDPEWLLSAATFRKDDERLPVQAVNTTLLSLALGQRLELGRKALLNLGMSALFSTTGFRRIGVSLAGEIAKGSLVDTEGPGIQPLECVKEILQTPALTRGQRDRILVAYERCQGRDGSGYPRAIPGKPKHLFSSIVTITDRYCHLATSQNDREALSPPEALAALASRESFFEPRLLRIFTHLMGPFPIGTLVVLDTGEVAVVAKGPRDRSQLSRPRVRILTDRNGLPVVPVDFDLLTKRGGKYAASIREVVRPSQVPTLDPVGALFAGGSEDAA